MTFWSGVAGSSKSGARSPGGRGEAWRAASVLLIIPSRDRSSELPANCVVTDPESHDKAFSRNAEAAVALPMPSGHVTLASRTVSGFLPASLDLRGDARRRLADPSHVRTSFLCGSAGFSRRVSTTQQVEAAMHQHPSQG